MNRLSVIILVIIVSGVIFLFASHLGTSPDYSKREVDKVVGHELILGLNLVYWGEDITYPAKGFTIEDSIGIAQLSKDLIVDGHQIMELVRYCVFENQLFVETMNSKNNLVIFKSRKIYYSDKQYYLDFVISDSKIPSTEIWIEIGDNARLGNPILR